jgi:hypothetical protein
LFVESRLAKSVLEGRSSLKEAKVEFKRLPMA